jgi:hypothetical protein
MNTQIQREDSAELQHHLVVLSALAEKDVAVQAWTRLLELWSVEILDGISLRFLPAVYVNIGKTDPNFSQKVKGKYRYNTALNLGRLKKLKNVFRQFQNFGINYRIVKGFAIALRIESLGYRVMGDIDIVIQKRDLAQSLFILSNSGFTDKFESKCQNYMLPSNINKLTLINEDGIEIDLHVAETAFPSDIFLDMFKEDGVFIPFEELQLCIPSDENLIRHSLLHGMQFSAITDRWQALIDIKTIDDFRVRKSIFTSILLGNKFRKLLSNLRKSMMDFDSLQNSIFRKRALRLYYWKSRLMSHKGKLNTPLTHPRSRVNSNDFFWLSRFLYFLWNLINRKSLLERFISHVFGGFLVSAEKTITPGVNYRIRNEPSRFSVLNSDNDFRFKLVLTEKREKFEIYFDSANFDLKSYEVFCNGKLVGNSLKSGSFGVTIHDFGKKFEISFRNPSHSCQACCADFSDLDVRCEF